MAKTDTVRARVEPELEAEAETILRALGLRPAGAIRPFCRQVALRRGLPFAVEIPNAETRDAMREARERQDLTEWSSLDALKRAHG